MKYGGEIFIVSLHSSFHYNPSLQTGDFRGRGESLRHHDITATLYNETACIFTVHVKFIAITPLAAGRYARVGYTAKTSYRGFVIKYWLHVCKHPVNG